MSREDDTGRRPKVQSDDDRALRSRARSHHDSLGDTLDGEVQNEVVEEITDVRRILHAAGVEGDPRLAKVVRAVVDHVTSAERRSANRDMEVATVRGDGPQITAILADIAEKLSHIEHWQEEHTRWRLRLEGVDQRNGRLGRLTEELVELKKKIKGWRVAFYAALSLSGISLGGAVAFVWRASETVTSIKYRLDRAERDIDRIESAPPAPLKGLP